MTEPRPRARSSAETPSPSEGVVALPFGLLVFLGSFLLFQIELIMARLLLPTFGSSASVWTTCLMFYQGALFAGYLWAARASSWIARGRYRWAHVLFVSVPIFFLPFHIRYSDLPPVVAILLALTLSAGVPFLALSTTSVVAQAWFTTTGHSRREEPYFLYGLSNAGALLALLSYPFVIERMLDMHTQLLLWYTGYTLYVLVTAWCVRMLAREGDPLAVAESVRTAAPAAASTPRASILQWLLLSAGANALLMVVTSVISMDAPVPLIWILPLTLYLITLIICFAPNLPSERTIQTWSFAGLGITLLMLGALQMEFRPEIATIGLQNMILFVTCLLCHDRLVRSKPDDARKLGTFYLAISLGGWLGSVLIGIAVPLAFAGIASHSPDYVVAGLLIFAAFVAKDAAGWVVSLSRRPLRMAGAAAGVLVVLAAIGSVMTANEPGSVYGSRTFYGLYRVEDSGQLRRLYHGNTCHGVENLGKPGEPLAYYHFDSPIGRFFADNRGAPVAGIVGLGVGALAAYRQPGQDWDYYEIDPEVEAVARRFFTFLGSADSRVILGDARLSLQDTPALRYDVLVMDTFSSDFVPLHLITREAVQLYTSRLREGGVLFFHISNRLFDLDPILTRIGGELGLRLATEKREVAKEVSDATGRFPSIWYAMTTDPVRHAHLIGDLGWSDRTAAAAASTRALWTDDYVNLFDAMK